eukprot:11214527-Lingulodinium_polyedra.AAC.1
MASFRDYVEGRVHAQAGQAPTGVQRDVGAGGARCNTLPRRRAVFAPVGGVWACVGRRVPSGGRFGK